MSKSVKIKKVSKYYILPSLVTLLVPVLPEVNNFIGAIKYFDHTYALTRS